MLLRTIVASSFLSLVAATSSPTHSAPPADSLLAGLAADVPVFGTPGELAVWGPEASCVLAAAVDKKTLAPLAARGVMGKGRVVCFAHTGYVGGGDDGPALSLLASSVTWASGVTRATDVTSAAGDATPRRVGVVHSEAAASLGRALGDAADVVELTGDWTTSLKECACVVVSGWELTDAQVEALRAFVRAGGGLVAGQTAWAWQPPAGTSLIDNPLNRVVAEAGIAWTGGYTGKTGPKGLTLDAGPASLNAATAIETLSRGDASKAEKEQAMHSLVAAARVLPVNDSLLRPRLTRLRSEGKASAIPSEQTPVKSSDSLSRAVLAFEIADLEREEHPAAHPAAANFPGLPPADAPIVHAAMTIDPSVEGWHSTGIYAIAGKPITVTLASGETKASLGVRIGCHADDLWHLPAWKRVPTIAVDRPLASGTTTLTSAFGGPVYIEVRGKAKNAARRDVKVTIDGGCDAPLFRLGVTTVEEWKQRRAAPGPWAELGTSKVFLSVPSSLIRTLDDPTPVLQFWDRVIDAQDEFGGVDAAHAKQQRYVADIQISAGYMHSGYPIMTHLDAASDMVSLERMRKGPWGLFHELGHNHQSGLWTFEGTGEVTNNVFAMYTIDTVCGLPWIKGHEGLSHRDRQIAKYVGGGRAFEKWKSDPFLALQMYAQLVEGFGWQPFKDVFATYRDLPASQRPRTEQQKRDQWMVRMSTRVQRNLGPFFDAWGVPVTQEAKASVKSLPEWMPADAPAAATPAAPSGTP